jgi:hypothetical protein
VSGEHGHAAIEKVAQILAEVQAGGMWQHYTAATRQFLIVNHKPTARAVLKATAPTIRQQVAEEIAQAIEAEASDTSYSEPEAVTEHLLKAAQTARKIGGES